MKIHPIVKTALVVLAVMFVVYRVEPVKDFITNDTGFF